MRAPFVTPKLQKVLIITLCWTLVLSLAYINSYFTIRDHVVYGRLSGNLPFWPDLLGNIVLAVIGGLVGGYLLVYKLNSGYRQRSFLSGILMSGVAFLIIFLLLAVGLIFLMGFLYYAILEGVDSGLAHARANVLSNIATPSFAVSMVTWALLVLGTQFMLQVNDKFGQGTLWKFLTGKYYHPHQEERVFMFLDMKSSTTIAEQIGNTQYFQLLKELFQDITEPILRHHGEIHQYVGDEVVITWPVVRATRNHNCVRCFFNIKSTLDQRFTYYSGKYGVTPALKAGVHFGQATVGEIGVIKKDIVYSGDVLNTTSRIQEACNEYGEELLCSAELLALLPRSTEFTAHSIGEIALRGKSEMVVLSAVRMI